MLNSYRGVLANVGASCCGNWKKGRLERDFRRASLVAVHSVDLGAKKRGNQRISKMKETAEGEEIRHGPMKENADVAGTQVSQASPAKNKSQNETPAAL